MKNGGQQSRLAAKMVVSGGQVDLGAVSDGTQRRRGKAAFDDQGFCGSEEPLAGILAGVFLVA